MAFKVTIRDDKQQVLTTNIGLDLEATLRKAAKEIEVTEDEHLRIGVSESDWIGDFRESFFAYGHGLKDAMKKVRAMNKKSRNGGGR